MRENDIFTLDFTEFETSFQDMNPSFLSSLQSKDLESLHKHMISGYRITFDFLSTLSSEDFIFLVAFIYNNGYQFPPLSNIQKSMLSPNTSVRSILEEI